MSARKYVVLLGDGMPDLPIKSLGGRTPLMAAVTPNLDRLAREGYAGLAQTTPDGFPPGSDVTNMGILGYDPALYYTGRAPLEAAAMGVALNPGDVAYRCNLVTLRPVAEGLIMDDFSAGHIETAEAHELVNTLQEKLGDARLSFHPGVSYRHLMVRRGDAAKVALTPPHDISDQNIRTHLPKGDGADELLDIINRAQMVLRTHPANARRKAAGKKEANSIWLWGQGGAPTMPTLKEKRGLTGAMISAVDLMRGLGVYAGMRVIRVPGATGWIDTNYEGKAQACLDALREVDLVYLHVESPDESGHAGNLEYKIKAISDFDARVVGPVLAGLEKMGDFRVVALSDHPTPISIKTHNTDPVPFAIYPAPEKGKGAAAFDEKSAALTGARFASGVALFEYFTGA